MAGRIVRHAGEAVLNLMDDLEKLELFKGIRKKCFELSLCPDGMIWRKIRTGKDKGVVCLKAYDDRIRIR